MEFPVQRETNRTVGSDSQEWTGLELEKLKEARAPRGEKWVSGKDVQETCIQVTMTEGLGVHPVKEPGL